MTFSMDRLLIMSAHWRSTEMLRYDTIHCYQLVSMLKIKNPKSLTSILSNLKNFHSPEVVGPVSETQLQSGWKFQSNNLVVKGVKPILFNQSWFKSWPIVYDADPALNQLWANVSCISCVLGWTFRPVIHFDQEKLLICQPGGRRGNISHCAQSDCHQSVLSVLCRPSK